MHHYEAEIGSHRIRFYGDDIRARALVSRWIRLFWERHQLYIHAHYPGSIADAIDNGHHDVPTCTIYRSGALLSGFIFPAGNYRAIDHFELSPEPLAEFHRIASVKRVDTGH